MKKTVSTIIALAMAMTTSMLAQPAPAPKPATAPADPIVISAGSLTITQSEFEGALKTLPAEYQQYASGAGKKQFAEDYMRMKLLAAQGMKAGLDKDADLLRQLALMKENLIAQAQLKRIEKDIVVTDADLTRLYEAGKTQYEQVKAKHILIAFKGSPAAQAGKPELTEEQAKAKAAELHKKILAGASFEELAKTESDDVGSGANGGELGEFNRGQMVPEFEKAAFEAKAGTMTEPVRTQFGFHVIKVESHGFTPLETVKEVLDKQERQVRLQAALDKLKNESKVTFNETYFPAPPPAPAPEAPPAAEKKP